MGQSLPYCFLQLAQKRGEERELGVSINMQLQEPLWIVRFGVVPDDRVFRLKG